MDWPPYAAAPHAPVLVPATRPSRGRPRLNSEHPAQPMYFHDGHGMLMPAGGVPMYRAVSNPTAGAAQPRPASVVIHNNNWEEHSPLSSPRYSLYDDDYSDDGALVYHGRHRRAHSLHHSCSRSPSPRYYDGKLEARMEKLKVLEAKEKDEAAKKRFEAEQLAEAERARRKKKEEKEAKEKWIEEWKIHEEEKKRKEEKKKKEEDAAFKERMLKTFGKAGFSEDSVHAVLKKAEKKEKREKEGSGGEHKDHHKGKGKALMPPTYIKVNKKYLSPDTLEAYDLPWEWDVRDTNYIIIKRWITEYDQDQLFEHTRKLREKKRLESARVQLRKDKGKLMFVRDKSRSPSRHRS